MPKSTQRKTTSKSPAIAEAVAIVSELTPPQQTFVKGILEGLTDVDAYKAAFACSQANAERNAWRLRHRDCIKTALAATREAAITDMVLSLEQKRSILKMIVETEVGAVDQNSILCQSYKRTRKVVGRGEEAEEWETEEIKGVDKMRALELDAKLAGELSADKTAEKQADATLSLVEVLKAITHGKGK